MPNDRASMRPGKVQGAADPHVAAGISKLRGLVILDVTRIGIDHCEEHADALLMLLHRPIR